MSYDHYETILVQRDGDVLTLTLNRPDAENAVNDVLHTELSTIFSQVRADPAKVIVLTGAGDWFCHAGDFDWYVTIEEEEFKKVMAEGKWIIHDAMTVPQPIIVALNGPAMGIGCTLVGLADVVIAAEDARIGDHHAGYGVVSGDGGVIFHPLSMGLMRAKQLYLLNKEIGAQELKELGIATSVHPREELMDEVYRVARELAELPAEGLQWTKWALNRAAHLITNITIDGSLGHQGWSYHLQPAREIRETKRFAYDESR